ncbi:hypothetical protein OKJ48_06620, partial [Streptomyces kunmingensis]
MPEQTEPNDPTASAVGDTPSDTLPPRRRRRAASRPAGPPAGKAAAQTAQAAAADAEPELDTAEEAQ